MDIPRINQQVVNWYAEKSFELKVQESEMSRDYPWLFGRGGLFSGILYEEVCEFPCQVIDGVWECPE